MVSECDQGRAGTGGQWAIDFSINDANLDLQRSLAGVDDYLAKGVDVLVFTPVNQEASVPTVKKAMDTGIPVILKSSNVEGATTLVAIDDYALGFEVGQWSGKYVQDNFNGEARVLDIGLPALTPCVDRSTGFVDGLKSVVSGRPARAVGGRQGVEGRGSESGCRCSYGKPRHQRNLRLRSATRHWVACRRSRRRAWIRRICWWPVSVAKARHASRPWKRAGPTRSPALCSLNIRGAC